MKRGGQVIYAGPLGQHSHKLVEYFEVGLDHTSRIGSEASDHFDLDVPLVSKLYTNCSNLNMAKIYMIFTGYPRGSQNKKWL